FWAPREFALPVKSGGRQFLEQAQLPERARNLVGARDSGVRDAVGRAPADLGAAKAHRAGARPERAGDEIEDGALARAVRTDEAEDLALGHLEGNVPDGGKAAERLAEPGDLQH